MLGFIASAVGGIVKDISVATGNVVDYIVDDVCSIPASFEAGYESGIISGESHTEDYDHHVDAEQSIAEIHGEPSKKFGKVA